MIRGGALGHSLHIRVDKAGKLQIFLLQEGSSQRCHQTHGQFGFKQHNSSSHAELSMGCLICEKLHCNVLDLIYKIRLLVKRLQVGVSSVLEAMYSHLPGHLLCHISQGQNNFNVNSVWQFNICCTKARQELHQWLQASRVSSVAQNFNSKDDFLSIYFLHSSIQFFMDWLWMEQKKNVQLTVAIIDFLPCDV